MNFATPILFLIFNRPEETRRVFAEISKQQPDVLYIAADGPRMDRSGEAEKCARARAVVMDHIDWECEVHTLFRTDNMGCGKAVSSAITWFFENVEEGIILEDDCLPHESFFRFAAEMLAKYRSVPQILHIGGINLQKPKNGTGDSYYFSNYIHIWGWATWRRAWQNYNYDLPAAGEEATQFLKHKSFSKPERNFWLKSFQDIACGLIDTWDTQWVYTFYKHNGIGITPAQNLVSNIGFGPDATHTQDQHSAWAAQPLAALGIIKHPKKIKIARKADRYSFRLQSGGKQNILQLLRFRLGKKFPFLKSTYLHLYQKLTKAGGL